MRFRNCLVCLTPFKSVRKDAEFCSPACRQKASRDRRKGVFVPAWTDYRVAYAWDVFTLYVDKYKMWASIDNTDDSKPYPMNWRDLIKYHMKEYYSVLFICRYREDIMKVVDEIEKNRELVSCINTK